MLTVLETLSPEMWVAFGLAIVIVDLFALTSFYGIFIGLTMVLVSAVDALGASAATQGWCLVLGAPVITYLGFKVINHRSRRQSEEDREDLIGLAVRVAAQNRDNPMLGIVHVPGHGEWQARGSHGALVPGQTVYVTARETSVLVVSREAIPSNRS